MASATLPRGTEEGEEKKDRHYDSGLEAVGLVNQGEVRVGGLWVIDGG